MAHQQRVVDLLNVYRIKHRQFNAAPYYDPRYSHHFPFFGFGTIEMMMRDSRIRFGLGLIKGPIYAYTKFFSSKEAEDPQINDAIIDLEYYYSHKVEADNEQTEKFVLDTLNDFWADGLYKALRSIEWGFSPTQVIYCRDPFDGLIKYKTLLSYTPSIARPVTVKNEFVGLQIKTTQKYIPCPKSAIFVHQREYSQFTGQSRLLGCHIPWHETWQMGGARDIRRVWFYKNAYDSGTLYFPEGSVTDPQTGRTIDNLEVAIEMMDATQTGSYRVLPKPEGGKNDKTWDYESPKGSTTPDGLMEYPQDLRSEILEGMGIPREVVESNGSTGFGSSSGRKVPMLAFIASLSPIVTETLTDFRSQILNPALRANNMSLNYRITRIVPKRSLPSGPGEGGRTQTSMSKPSENA